MDTAETPDTARLMRTFGIRFLVLGLVLVVAGETLAALAVLGAGTGLLIASARPRS
ncbi:hypothetical protein [Amycolatopsis sp. CA-230715]|uniref:hypothetical protein n=1 Tax=Amycolatopsis sp. CA-230715 TaxID=2745196 RepID=UPI001C02ABA6|nr:hypothetical protein [Amycolatopsis sp. CA-230715]